MRDTGDWVEKFKYKSKQWDIATEDGDKGHTNADVTQTNVQISEGKPSLV